MIPGLRSLRSLTRGYYLPPLRGSLIVDTKLSLCYLIFSMVVFESLWLRETEPEMRSLAIDWLLCSLIFVFGVSESSWRGRCISRACKIPVLRFKCQGAT